MIKFFGGILILILNTIFSFIPLFNPPTSWVSRAESVAAGVFIGAGIVHLFPEAIHCFGLISTPYPIIITIISYFTMLLIEKSVDENEFPGHNHNEEEDDNVELHNTGSISKSTIMFYLVLQFHSFVESFAFGFLKSESSLLALLFALIGHKPVECFVLGLQILNSRTSRTNYIILMTIFAGFSPLTMLLSSLFARSTGEIFTGIVTSISTGVFFYVGFHELGETLEKCKFSDSKIKLSHVLWFIFGLFWMAGFTVLTSEHHHD